MKNKKANNIIKKKGVKNMKFIKGIMLGGLITTGIVMMYSENDMFNKKKMMKKGRQMARKIGIM